MLLKLNALIVVLPILQEKVLNKPILGVGAKNGDLNVLVRDAENSLFTSIILIILNWMAFGSFNKDMTIWYCFVDSQAYLSLNE